MPSLAVRSVAAGGDRGPLVHSERHNDGDVAINSSSEAPISELTKRNRRKGYLDLHPEYFSTLELAGPPLSCWSKPPDL